MVDSVPCVIQNTDRTIVDVTAIDDKGCSKSLETGTLWALHGETGKLLPYDEDTKLVELKKNPTWCRAVIQRPGASVSSDTPARKSRPPAEAETGSNSPGGEDPAAEADILFRLSRLIRRRKTELPEGSYTTHLFRSGSDKIRKKTGEEAVELLLARNKNEIIYEASDLIYHLLVLLEASDIEFRDILTELESRFGEDC